MALGRSTSILQICVMLWLEGRRTAGSWQGCITSNCLRAGKQRGFRCARSRAARSQTWIHDTTQRVHRSTQREGDAGARSRGQVSHFKV